MYICTAIPVYCVEQNGVAIVDYIYLVYSVVVLILNINIMSSSEHGPALHYKVRYNRVSLTLCILKHSQ